MTVRVFFAAGILALILCDTAAGQPQPADVPKATQQIVSSKVQVPQSPQSVQVSPQPITDTTPADSSNYFNQADLDAQRRMANANEVLARLTFWQLFVGVVGTIGLIASIALSAWAAKSASKAANAAQAALGNDRAWIVQHGTRTGFGTATVAVTVPAGPALMLAFNWANDGRSPALDVESNVAFQVLPRNSPMPLLELNWPEDTGRTAIGPGVGFSTSEIYVVGDNYADVLSEACSVFARCTVRYRDTFNTSIQRISTATAEIYRNGSMQDEQGNIIPRILVRQGSGAVT